MTDLELQELANSITAIAHQYRDARQLRERIAAALASALEEVRARAGEPVAPGCIRLRVTTRHPQDYLLCNQKDGTRWRGSLSGAWVSARDDKDASCLLPFPRHALRGYSESQVKNIRIGWNMRERAAQAMQQGRCPMSARTDEGNDDE